MSERLRSLLRRPWLVAGLLALVCFGVGAAVSIAHWPAPKVHDEFSYLLAADTFAHGRLTNPTHPKWQHFETFHVIQQPSYASKYPPGQGLALAAGEVATGEPLVGVWMLSALGAVVAYWMLLASVAPRYAVLGATLWLAHPGAQLVWGQSYWGGTLAFISAALVVGAALRMRRRTWARDAAAMAVGAVVLAVTRPYEGLALCAFVGVWVLAMWIRARVSLRDIAVRFVLPMAAIVGLGGLGLGAYHKAVTGSPLTFPYAIHEAAYGQSPLFVGGSPAPKPVYRHAVIDEFHSDWEMGWYRLGTTPLGWIYSKIAAVWIAAEFFVTPIMGVGLLLLRPWRWRRLTPVAAVAVLTVLACLAVTWNLPHYFAPAAPLLIVAATAGLRRADVFGRRRLGGWRIGTGLVALQVVLFAVAAVNTATAPRGGWWDVREQVTAQLGESPQKQVILVRYGAGHSPHQEWVYNGADIDGGHIVWARSMNAASDAELLRYFKDRQAWLLEPESQSLQMLEPNAALTTNTSGSLPSAGATSTVAGGD